MVFFNNIKELKQRRSWAARMPTGSEAFSLLLERRSVTSRYYGSKISGPQQ